QRYDQAHHACEHAMARYDQLDLLLHLLREALHLCSPCGRLRTAQGVRAALTSLLSLIAEIEDAVLPKLLKSIRSHLDDIVAPFEQVDALVQSSSLFEMVNAFIRPYLSSSPGHITQETLNLIMFYHNHRRYKSGKRQGKAPIELLTGDTLRADWVDLLIQHTQAVSQGTSLSPGAPLELVPHRHERTTPSQPSPGPAILEHMQSSDSSWSP